MFRYTSEMVGLRATGREHAAPATAHAVARFACVLALVLLCAALLPTAASASPSIEDLEAQALDVRREVSRLLQADVDGVQLGARGVVLLGEDL